MGQKSVHSAKNFLECYAAGAMTNSASAVDIEGAGGARAGFRKGDRKRDRRSTTTSTPGFENLSTALQYYHDI